MSLARVLLVDDEEDLRVSTAQALELHDLKVETFSAAEDVLAHVGPGFAGVVVSDIRMAGMDGMTLLQRIREIDHDIREGAEPWEAIVEATVRRFRPIMLTAAAAILGMIPIMHDVFWGPMAYAIVGGLAVATALTLVFLPALYVAVNGIRETGEPAVVAPA